MISSTWSTRFCWEKSLYVSPSPVCYSIQSTSFEFPIHFQTIEDFILLVGTFVAFVAFVLWCCFPVSPKENGAPPLYEDRYKNASLQDRWVVIINLKAASSQTFTTRYLRKHERLCVHKMISRSAECYFIFLVAWMRSLDPRWKSAQRPSRISVKWMDIFVFLWFCSLLTVSCCCRRLHVCMYLSVYLLI